MTLKNDAYSRSAYHNPKIQTPPQNRSETLAATDRQTI